MEELLQQLIDRLTTLEDEFDSLPDLSIIQAMIKDIEALKQNETFTKETLKDAVAMFGDGYFTDKQQKMIILINETINKINQDATILIDDRAIELSKRLSSEIAQFKTDYIDKTELFKNTLVKMSNEYQIEVDNKLNEYQIEVDNKVNDAIAELKSKLKLVKNGIDGKDGAKGDKGDKGFSGSDGIDGKDGVGIVNITYKSNILTIFLSDNTKKEIKLNIPQYLGSGGGGISEARVLELAGGKYTNLSPVPYTLGGVVSGTTFNEASISEIIDMLLYPYSIGLTINPTQGVKGQTINSTLLAFQNNSWAETLSLNNGVGDVSGLDNYTYTSPINDNITFALTATKGSTIKTASASIIFLNYIFWGVTANPYPLNVEILASNKKLSDSKSLSVNYDCTGGKRYYIAYPSRLGIATLKINNFPNNNTSMIERTLTNEFGYSENYTIIYGNTIVNGSNIPAQWS